MDGLGQDVDGQVRLDGDDALVDRGRRLGAGHRGTDELAHSYEAQLDAKQAWLADSLRRIAGTSMFKASTASST